MEKVRLDSLIVERDRLAARLTALRAQRAQQGDRPGEVQGPVPGDPAQAEIDRLEPQLASVEAEIAGPGF